MAGDPYFSSVVLLLHCDGADGSTTFTDHSPLGKTVTAVGNAQIDTAQSKFGGASGLFDGTGDYIQISDSVHTDFGTGDFTIEEHVRFNSLGSLPAAFYDNDDTATVTSGIIIVQQTSSIFRVRILGTDYDFSWTPSTGTWYHVAVSRSGSSLRAFVEGSQIGTTQTNSSNITNSLTARFGLRQSGIQGLNGWLDDIRITKGVARYTADYTPSIIPFPNRGLNAVAAAHHYRMRRAA